MCHIHAQAEVDADSLQMLHAAHNLLEVLDHAKELQLPARQISPEQVILSDSNSSRDSRYSVFMKKLKLVSSVLFLAVGLVGCQRKDGVGRAGACCSGFKLSRSDVLASAVMLSDVLLWLR